MFWEIFDFLFLEDEEIRVVNYTLIFAIIILAICSIVNLYLIYRIYSSLKILESIDMSLELNEIIGPIFRMTLFFGIRYIISLFNFTIWYFTNQETSLNGAYETLIWLFILREFWLITSNQKLVQIPRKRFVKFSRIHSFLLFFIFTASVALVVQNFIVETIIFQILFFIPIIIIGYFLYYFIKIEIDNTDSKINKIRLGHLNTSWSFMIIHVLAITIGYGLMPIIFPENQISGPYYLIVILLMLPSPLLAAISVYWSVFIPKWSRNKFGITSPKEFIK